MGPFVLLQGVVEDGLRFTSYTDEASLAPGVPIMRTLDDVIKTGDTIVRIEALLNPGINVALDGVCMPACKPRTYQPPSPQKVTPRAVETATPTRPRPRSIAAVALPRPHPTPLTPFLCLCVSTAGSRLPPCFTGCGTRKLGHPVSPRLRIPTRACAQRSCRPASAGLL